MMKNQISRRVNLYKNLDSYYHISKITEHECIPFNMKIIFLNLNKKNAVKDIEEMRDILLQTANFIEYTQMGLNLTATIFSHFNVNENVINKIRTMDLIEYFSDFMKLTIYAELMPQNPALSVPLKIISNILKHILAEETASDIYYKQRLIEQRKKFEREELNRFQQLLLDIKCDNITNFKQTEEDINNIKKEKDPIVAKKEQMIEMINKNAEKYNIDKCFIDEEEEEQITTITTKAIVHELPPPNNALITGEPSLKPITDELIIKEKLHQPVNNESVNDIEEVSEQPDKEELIIDVTPLILDSEPENSTVIDKDSIILDSETEDDSIVIDKDSTIFEFETKELHENNLDELIPLNAELIKKQTDLIKEQENLIQKQDELIEKDLSIIEFPLSTASFNSCMLYNN
ncbi:hypothetical protein SGHV047 [Glossina pallidipes salivary gland hypertrophy virus]|uniref:Uncharacterized protein n=1 Tax=Glossina hytrovirus (isolate Glossina pallidipes/Ethiopia/Seibersdorf/-) TaxID=379529 RepID=B0YLK1_GHVS|nr:hypothetical protein SGHV047 [Glossina pallidipes salivary gland hypertrophy virus]ABQ08820.1 hypothetical protein SGHV047 [Glossina pallidipes salivary gland hypertrophy virus]